jgi:hypothetical protein
MTTKEDTRNALRGFWFALSLSAVLLLCAALSGCQAAVDTGRGALSLFGKALNGIGNFVMQNDGDTDELGFWLDLDELPEPEPFTPAQID